MISLVSDEQIKFNRSKRKKDRTRQQIVSFAMDLFQKQGFPNTTMEQIAESVDISKQTLYNYFPEKEAIVSSFIQGMMSESHANIDELIHLYPDIRSCLLAVFKQASELAEANRDIYQVYLAYRQKNLTDSSRHKELRTGLESFFTLLFEYARKTGQIRKDIPITYLTKQLEMSYGMSLLTWLGDPAGLSLHESLAYCVDLFLNGAKAEGEKIYD